MTIIVAPVLDGNQTVEERLKKILSEMGSFAQFEVSLSEYKKKFQTTSPEGIYPTSPINELKFKFYQFIDWRIRSLVEGLNVSEIPDIMDGLPGYTQQTIAMRKLVKKILELQRDKPWLHFQSMTDETGEIKNLISELISSIEDLKLTLGGWTTYY